MEPIMLRDSRLLAILVACCLAIYLINQVATLDSRDRPTYNIPSSIPYARKSFETVRLCRNHNGLYTSLVHNCIF